MKKIVAILLVLIPLFDCYAQADTAIKKSDYFIAKDSTRIYYEVYGKGTPVLLVHGFMNTGANWKKSALFTQLLNAGYQIIIPDLRGNGQSDKPHTAAGYANNAEAKDLQQLMSLLKIKHYSVVGYSRGCTVAARLILLDKHVQKCVLGGMGDFFTNPLWSRRLMFYHALIADTVPELHEMVNNVNKNKNLDRLALAYQQDQQPTASAKELATIKIPVKVICGDQDTADGSGAALAAMIPGAIFKEVPGEHGPVMVSQIFADEVLSFFKNNSK